MAFARTVFKGIPSKARRPACIESLAACLRAPHALAPLCAPLAEFSSGPARRSSSRFSAGRLRRHRDGCFHPGARPLVHTDSSLQSLDRVAYFATTSLTSPRGARSRIFRPSASCGDGGAHRRAGGREEGGASRHLSGETLFSLFSPPWTSASPSKGPSVFTRVYLSFRAPHPFSFQTSFTPMRNTISGRAEKTLMKLIVDGTTDRVLVRQGGLLALYSAPFPAPPSPLCPL